MRSQALYPLLPLFLLGLAALACSLGSGGSPIASPELAFEKLNNGDVVVVEKL